MGMALSPVAAAGAAATAAAGAAAAPAQNGDDNGANDQAVELDRQAAWAGPEARAADAAEWEARQASRLICCVFCVCFRWLPCSQRTQLWLRRTASCAASSPGIAPWLKLCQGQLGCVAGMLLCLNHASCAAGGHCGASRECAAPEAAEAERCRGRAPGAGGLRFRVGRLEMHLWQDNSRMAAQSFITSLLAKPCRGPRQLQWSRSWSSGKICNESGG
jgi:hypothetical protein